MVVIQWIHTIKDHIRQLSQHTSKQLLTTEFIKNNITFSKTDKEQEKEKQKQNENERNDDSKSKSTDVLAKYQNRVKSMKKRVVYTGFWHPTQ